MAYTPPAGNAVEFNLGSVPYNPPTQTAVHFVIYDPAGAIEQGIGPSGWDSSAYGAAAVSNKNQYLYPPGAAPTNAFGATYAYNLNQLLYPTGAAQTVFGASADVYNLSATVAPSSWVSSTVPAPYVYNLTQVVRPSGWTSAGFGTSTVDLFIRRVYPNGWVSGDFGATVVSLYTRYLYPAGLDATGWGTPQVDNNPRYVYAGTVAPATEWGTANVELELRTLPSVGAGEQTGYGGATVMLARRDLYPSGWRMATVGTPYVDYYLRQAAPAGFESSTFGTAEVKDKTQRVYPIGRVSALGFGVPTVTDLRQWLYPFSQAHTEWGPHTSVGLYTRYVHPQGWYGHTNAYPQVQPPAVANRNRSVYANGSLFSRYGISTVVENLARAVYPAGFDAAEYGNALVADAVREVYPEAFESSYFGLYGFLVNRLKIDTDGWGWRSSRFGIPARVWSNLQTVYPVGVPPADIGVPWVAEGTRYVYQQPTLLPPEGYPWVSFATRSIHPTGWDNPVGYPLLYIYKPTVSCWGFDAGGVGGAAEVRNVTPEVRPFGAYTEEAGRPRVELLTRYVSPAGEAQGAVERPFVAYRTRTLYMFSTDFLRIGMPTVGFDPTQLPPPQQTVRPDGPFVGGAGTPTVRTNVVYPVGIGATFFGAPTMRSMAVLVDTPIDSLSEVGTPLLLGGTQWVYPNGFGGGATPGVDQIIGPQTVDVGRYYVPGPPPLWIPYDPPLHAQGDPYATVSVPQSAGEVFGARTRVEPFHRQLLPQPFLSSAQTQYGYPHLGQRPTYVRPPGFVSYVRGIPDVSHVGEKFIDLTAYGNDEATFGQTVVILQDYGPKYVTGVGLGETLDFSANLVWNLHREIYPNGWLSFISLTQAYVGDYLRLYPEGSAHDSYGTPRVEYTIRRVYQEPVVDDRPPYADSKATVVKHEPRGYYIEGSTFPQTFGVAQVTRRDRSVYPSGWEEFQTGFSYVPEFFPGFSNVDALAFLASPGLDSMEFGNGTTVHT